MTNKKPLKMAIEIVDFPSYKMVMFHSYVNVYQRVVDGKVAKQLKDENPGDKKAANIAAT